MEVRFGYYLQVDALLSTQSGIVMHDISQRIKTFSVPQAHKGKVTGLTFASGNRLLSCGVDRHVRLWDTQTKSVRLYSRLAFLDTQEVAGPTIDTLLREILLQVSGMK
jgi:WD40 repeat protein